VVVGAVCLGALTLAACGGGGERLSRPAFDREANEACVTLQDASESLRRAQEPDAVGADVTEHVASAAGHLRDLVDALGELTPPAAIESDVDDLLDVLEQYADRLEDLGERAGPQQTLQEVLDANSEAVAALNDLAQRSSNIVQKLGLTGCMLAS